MNSAELEVDISIVQLLLHATYLDCVDSCRCNDGEVV